MGILHYVYVIILTIVGSPFQLNESAQKCTFFKSWTQKIFNILKFQNSFLHLIFRYLNSVRDFLFIGQNQMQLCIILLPIWQGINFQMSISIFFKFLLNQCFPWINFGKIFYLKLNTIRLNPRGYQFLDVHFNFIQNFT